MNLIVKVSSETPRAPLLQLLHVPLGLDVWEVKPDHLVLRATEAQVHRLEQIGYRVAQLHETATFLSTFATAEALAGYHSVQTLEQELKTLAASRPEIVELSHWRPPHLRLTRHIKPGVLTVTHEQLLSGRTVLPTHLARFF